jgi:hypothetical protein
MPSSSLAGDEEFDVAGREPDPAVACAEEEAVERLRASIIQQISGDQLVEGLFACLAAGDTKPEDIAVLLDEKVRDVNNGQKRLRRTVEAILKNNRNG